MWQFIEYGRLQAAVDKATEVIVEGVRDFEEAVRQLSSRDNASKEDIKSRLLDFWGACRYQYTGNLIWR